MNHTIEDRLQPQLLYAVSFGCIMVLGLPLNAVSLWILLRRHHLKSPSVVFMVNLALSDLLLVISLPMRIYFYATGTWPLSSRACNLITMLFRNNIRSSSIFITFISVDRLLAVVYPLRSRHLRTSSNAWRAAVLVWLFVLAVNIPESLNFSRVLQNKSEAACFEFVQHDRFSANAIVCIQFLLMFTTLVVNIVCTALVFWTLRRHLSESAKISNRVNVMLIFVMNLVMFTICFLPFNIGILTSTRPVFTALTCLASLNCCMDPLLYYFSLDAFWKKQQDEDLAREQ